MEMYCDFLDIMKQVFVNVFTQRRSFYKKFLFSLKGIYFLGESLSSHPTNYHKMTGGVTGFVKQGITLFFGLNIREHEKIHFLIQFPDVESCELFIKSYREKTGIYHMITYKYLRNYRNEFVYKLNRRYLGEKLCERLISASVPPYLHG